MSAGSQMRSIASGSVSGEADPVDEDELGVGIDARAGSAASASPTRSRAAHEAVLGHSRLLDDLEQAVERAERAFEGAPVDRCADAP